ncbi:ATP-dependent DNA helicase [Microbacterium sp. SCN 69-37]|uniref:ATP-dependent helicase n=1 Tax=Microbacterium sp. SCN 69-37 TaxID=1660115 RepID=UPI00086C6E7E|nr:ATP-dependent DNA helicase [Microbacterium sp. SCN 69-37]ODT25804.1 MAG: DNA helicase [Microbacterium sp. SCN 69-37]
MTAYTPAQQAAIDEVAAPLQLIACAGSGKTQVISQRISRILSLPGARPGNVIAFTFTEKAAAELKDRIHRIVRDEHGDLPGLAEMYVGTMHGFALSLLQTYVPEAFKYGVLTDITQRLLIDRESTKSGLTTCPTTAPSRPTLWRYADSKLYMQVLAVLQEDEVDFELVPDGVTESLHSYAELLSRRKYFDYTAMIATAVAFLESDPDDPDLSSSEREMLRYVREDVKYVVVDEYQDVNPLQEKLIAGLVRWGANLCVVGDDDQTIYQWRGSEVSNILTFADRHEDVRTIELADNFRSSKGIVRLGRSVAEWLPPEERLPKAMEYASHQVWERGDMLALEFVDPSTEAAWIADRVEALRGMPFIDTPEAAPRGLSWSDCAVLYRTVKDAEPLVDELRRRGIPYIIKGLARLFDAPEIVALVGMFQFMVDEIDEVELRRLFGNANLLGSAELLARGIHILRQGSDFDRGDRWGTYNIQRLYLDVLEALDIREATIPGTPARAELVMYQLGKFSQVISDFESINFASDPRRKYEGFVKFVTQQNQAPAYYEEADEDASFATPDAVTITTVHRAKGMQWPAVFVPCLRKNRFPIRSSGGLNVFHVIPVEAVPNGPRYRGGLSEETRLFYVAVTRAQKYLYMSWAPIASNQQARRQSDFFRDVSGSDWVLTTDPGLPPVDRLTPVPKVETPAITISFSELKYLLECPYQFKLRFMYGFNPPIHEALGYGKGLHDALAEMHKRSLAGDVPMKDEVEDLVDRHLHTPYAYPALREQLRGSAIKALARYFDEHGDDLTRTEHSEKQIEVVVSPGVTVDGRIDLIKRLETDEVSIVDFKSTEDAQKTSMTRDQLSVYALGYQELTGTSADRIQVLNLDDKGDHLNEPVDATLLAGIRSKIEAVAGDIRTDHFPCGHDHSKDTAYNDLAWLTTGAL